MSYIHGGRPAERGAGRRFGPTPRHVIRLSHDHDGYVPVWDYVSNDKGTQRNNPSVCLRALAVAGRALAAGFPGTFRAPRARRFMIVVANVRYKHVSYHDHRNEPEAKIKPAC
jgi:hypothetical protein